MRSAPRGAGAGLAATLAWAALAAGCNPEPQQQAPLPQLSGMERQVAQLIVDSVSRVRHDPESAEAWGRLGNVYDAHGFHREAATCYRQALALDPASFAWIYNLAIVLDVQGEPMAEISPLFERAAELKPSYAQVPYRLGEAWSRRGDHAAARAQLERAVEIDAGFAPGHRALGQILLNGGELPRAVDHLRRAAALDPADGAVQAALSRALMLAGDPVGARAAADLAGRLKPRPVPDPARAEVLELNTSATAVAARARAAMDGGRYPEAIELLLAAEAWKPGSATVQYNLGVCYLRTEQPELARKHLRQAVAIADDPEAHWRLGVLLIDGGDRDAGLQHLRRAALRAPDDGPLLAQLATSLARSGAAEEALDLFRRAAEVADGAALQNNWGAALLDLGRDAEALERFRRAIELDSSRVDAQLNAGRALERLGRPDEAAAVYRAALARDPSGAAGDRLAALGLEDSP